jgi:tetratricopeptide (TPR) repeat protein
VTVIGDTVNVAARLEKAAGPGEVLCGPLTAELVGWRVTFRPRQAVILKGKKEPVDVFEAVALRPAGSAPAADDVPLVGRSHELSYLSALWQRVAREELFQLVVLCGEPGSGKTRLASELVDLAAAEGHVVRVAYPAYGPLGGVKVAAEMLRQVGLVDDEEVIARVRSLAGMTSDALKSMDPGALQKEQLWGLVRLLEQKAADRPLLIVIDDAHRSSERLLGLLDELTRRLTGAPILLVLAGRTDPSAWLGHFPAATTVRLGPLSRADSVALADALACDNPLSEQAAEFLVDRSGGNPLYLRELLRVARASGSLTLAGGEYKLGPAAALPASLHAVLSARLDGLSGSQKLTFQHVAVLGSGATESSVEQLAGDPATAATLRALADAGLVRRTHEGAIETVDPLLAEVAYETLPRNVRGDLHRRASSICAVPEEQARHMERAAEFLSDDEEVSREAADLLGGMGEDYAKEARYPEALRLLERAAALGCRRPSVLLTLADLQGMSGDAEAALATLGSIEDDPADPVMTNERDHAAGRVRLFSDPAVARPALERVARRWQELDRPLEEAWAIANAGVASFNLNRMADAATDLERAHAMFERLGDRPGAISSSSFLCLVNPGDPRAPQWLADGLAFADETGERDKQAGALNLLTWNLFIRSMFGGPDLTADTVRFGLRLADTAEQIGADEMELQGRSILAITYRWTGRFDEAAEQQAALSRIVDRAGHHQPWIAWASGFSVAMATGNTTAAPPFPPLDLTDSVAAVAGLVLRAELLFAGRLDEASARMEALDATEGSVRDTGRVIDALTLVLTGRMGEAGWAADGARRAADALDAEPIRNIARALLAEIAGDPALLPPVPPSAESVSDAVVLRAHALAGDASAAARLEVAAKALALPGLLPGI